MAAQFLSASPTASPQQVQDAMVAAAVTWLRNNEGQVIQVKPETGTFRIGSPLVQEAPDRSGSTRNGELVV